MIAFTKQTVKDLQKLKNARISENSKDLVNIILNNPYQNPPRYEKLVGKLEGVLSRRINYQHCLVHKVYEDNFEESGMEYQDTIKIIRM